MKKIILVHFKYAYGKIENGEDYGFANAYPSAFLANGYEAFHFFLEDYFSLQSIEDDLIKFAGNICPDLIFFNLIQNEVSEYVLSFLKTHYVTMNWFSDDEWRFDIFSCFKCHLFTFSITTDRFALVKYKGIGYDKVILSQWSGFDSLRPNKLKLSDFKYEVSFVGMANTYRRWVVDLLRKNGIQIHVFGPGWGTEVPDYEKMAEIFYKSKISLNLENSISFDVRYLFSSFKAIAHTLIVKKNSNQIKARNFEVPYYGGFLITNYCPDLGLYFNIDHDLICYNNLSDLIKLIKFYLAEGNIHEYQKLKSLSYLNAVKNHGLNSRISEILNIIKG